MKFLSKLINSNALHHACNLRTVHFTSSKDGKITWSHNQRVLGLKVINILRGSCGWSLTRQHGVPTQLSFSLASPRMGNKASQESIRNLDNERPQMNLKTGNHHKILLDSFTPSTSLEPWIMQCVIRSLKLMRMWLEQLELGYMSSTSYSAYKVYTHLFLAGATP